MLLTSPPGSLLGASRPRVELRPADAEYSFGEVAVELATRAGLPPEPWQADGLEVMLGVRADNRWAAREYGEIVGRQQGKSAGLGVPRALAGLLLLGERLIMWSAHEYKTAMESFLTCRDALVALGKQVGPNAIVVDGVRIRVNNTNGEEGFATSTGQRLRFIARSKGSGRGFSGDCNIVDEAFAYTRAQQSALSPTMLARPNPQTIYLSSPPLDGDSGEVLFGLKARGEAGDIRLGWRDWGLGLRLDDLARMAPDERRALLDDRANWAATLPALGRGRVTVEAVDQLRREMDEFDFAREVTGCWPMQGDGSKRVLTEKMWDPLADPESQIAGAVVFGIDATPDRSAAAIGAAGVRDDDVDHVEVVEQRPGLGWVVDRAVEMDTRAGGALWVIDPNGPAGSLVPDLEDAGLRLLLVSGGDYVRACGAFYDAVVQEALRHLDDPVLNAAAEAARRRPAGDGGFAWGRKHSRASIAPLVAVTLALWGLAVEGRGGPAVAPMAVESGQLATAGIGRIGF